MGKWEMVKLGDVCEIERGGSPRPIEKFITNDEDGINWIRIGDTSADSMYITKAKEKIIPEGIKKSRYVQAGDFLLSNSMSFGRPYILKIDGCIHDGWLVLRDKMQHFQKEYLYYALSSKSTYAKFKSIAVGGVVNNLNSNIVKQVEFPLPSLEEQKKIAKTLDATSKIIALRKKQLAELDNLIKSTFYDMFGDPVINEKGWNLVQIGNVGDCNSGGTPTRSNPDYFLGDIDWYSAGELNQRYLIQSKEKLTLAAIKNSAAKIFKQRSMLVGMYDTAAFKLGILTKDSASNQACANIDVNVDLLNIEWLYDCTQIMRPFFLESRRGVRQKNLNLGMIKRFEIPLPPLSLQNRFAEIVAKIEAQKTLVQKAIDESQYLFDSLMSEYFE